MSISEYELTILEHHLDTFGHVNHATYLQLFEEARWDIIDHRGYGIEEIQRSGVGPVILKVEIKYNRELRNRAKIKIVSEPQVFKGKIGHIKQKMLSPLNEVHAEITLTYGLMDMTERKLVSPPDKWLHAIGLT